MSVNLTLLTVMGALYACGIYLILERSLTRVLLGLMMLTNATNLLILTTGGYAGLAPLFSSPSVRVASRGDKVRVISADGIITAEGRARAQDT